MAYARYQQFDGDLQRWLPIVYRDFHDFPRLIIVRFQSSAFVFDSPFLEMKDEYSDHFIVHEREDATDAADDDLFASYAQSPVVDIVPVEKLVFDETHRKYLLRACLIDIWRRWDRLKPE